MKPATPTDENWNAFRKAILDYSRDCYFAGMIQTALIAELAMQDIPIEPFEGDKDGSTTLLVIERLVKYGKQNYKLELQELERKNGQFECLVVAERIVKPKVKKVKKAITGFKKVEQPAIEFKEVEKEIYNPNDPKLLINILKNDPNKDTRNECSIWS